MPLDRQRDGARADRGLQFQRVVGKALAVRLAARRHQLPRQQACPRRELVGGDLAVAGAGVGDQRIGQHLEQRIGPHVIARHLLRRRPLGAMAVDARGAGRGDLHPRAFLQANLVVEPVAAQHARRRRCADGQAHRRAGGQTAARPAGAGVCRLWRRRVRAAPAGPCVCVHAKHEFQAPPGRPGPAITRHCRLWCRQCRHIS